MVINISLFHAAPKHGAKPHALPPEPGTGRERWVIEHSASLESLFGGVQSKEHFEEMLGIQEEFQPFLVGQPE